ncbi:hypothetical protein RIVERRIDER_10 [Xanthomonas phage RiverRider]|uniref:Uncharacterized protein n=1 Tax=Xanthomonas phage RiverRider TaxID=2108116 RepID=A0A2P1JUS7_9CAUD|nr:hypothetical protein HWB58_gp10 [Xanthomonas phage RiverRider]AVO23098.1 hypothetical protein RIVERRIDER_10 [Xanthomonas phage RiverRider]
MKKYTTQQVIWLKEMLELLIRAKHFVNAEDYMLFPNESLRRGLCGAIWEASKRSDGVVNHLDYAIHQRLKGLIRRSLKLGVWFDDALDELNPGVSFSRSDYAKYRHQWIDQLIRDMKAAIKYSEKCDHEKDH